jgi:endonuclease/exonuclease/phosphatase (EEP) superfamily protein YafD
VDVEGRHLTILGLNPFAVVESAGLARQERQLDALIAHLPSVTLPFIVAGDLNTTAFRPKFRELMAVGLLDAHESLGQGLSASFKLSADGLLASPGPIVRLDHALTSDDVRAIEVHNLDGCGSDHLPFQVRLAIRTSSSERIVRTRRRQLDRILDTDV